MTNTQPGFSSKFATSIEDLVRESCIQGGAEPIELYTQTLEELKALSGSTKEMKNSFNCQLSKCTENVVEAETHICEISNDLSDMRAATQELVNAARQVDSVTPIRLGEKNLKELKALSSHGSAMKTSFDNKLNTCNKNMSDVMSEISTMRVNIEDVKGTAKQLVYAEEEVSTTRNQDGDISVRFGTQNTALLKDLKEKSTEMKTTFEQKLEACLEDMSVTTKDISEVKTNLREVKDATNILANVACNDDGSTAIRLKLENLDGLRTLKTGSKSTSTMMENQMKECNNSLIDVKLEINDAKTACETLVRRAGLTNNQAAEFGDCIDNLNTLSLDTATMKESFDKKLDICTQHMTNTISDINAMQKGMSDVTEATEELLKVSLTDSVAKSIGIEKQNLEELKKLSSSSTELKDSVDEKLNTYNKNMDETNQDINDMKKSIIDVKNATDELVKVVGSQDGAKISSVSSSVKEQRSCDGELKKVVSDSAKINESFSVELKSCNQNVSDAMNDISELKKQVNDVNASTEQLVKTVAYAKDNQACIQLGLLNLDEANKISTGTTKMNKSFNDKLDICNENLTEFVKFMKDVQASTQELVRKKNGQDPAPSLQNVDQNSLDKLKELSSGTSSMKVAFDGKLDSCNKNMKDVQAEIKFAEKCVNDMKTVTAELVEVAHAGESLKSLELGKQNHEEISKLCSQSTEMNASFNKSMDTFDQDMNELKKEMSDAMADLLEVKKGVSETKSGLDLVKNSLTKLTENLDSQNKIQRLEFAISNMTSMVENFKFQATSLKILGKPTDSHILIRKILVAFREGVGLYLPDGVKVNEQNPLEKPSEAKQQEFRDKICSQVRLLTGFKAGIIKKSNGRHSIFLS